MARLNVESSLFVYNVSQGFVDDLCQHFVYSRFFRFVDGRCHDFVDVSAVVGPW